MRNAVEIIKAAEAVKSRIARQRQRAYFKPFFEAKKPWAKPALRCSVSFSLDLHRILQRYQRSCAKLIQENQPFVAAGNVQKAKKYRTEEYLDRRYNHVVVPDVRDVLTEMTDASEKEIQESYERYITHGLVKDSAELVYKDFGMAFNFNKFDKDTRDYLRDKTIHWAKRVAESTEREVKRVLVDGYEKGEGTYNLARRLQEATGFSYSRCEAIARTEVKAACGYVEYQANLANDAVVGTKWSATADARTRPTHAAANGQKRKKGEPFMVGGYKLLYPGDSSLGAPAKEIIACRCIAMSLFEGEELESHTVYDEPDAGSQAWLERQKPDFQTEYWGGKTKKQLGDAKLIDLSDREKPLEEVLEQVYPVKVTPEALTAVSDLPEMVIDAMIARTNEVWLWGKLNKKEANVTLDASTGKKAAKNVIGQYGKIIPESENYQEWLKFLNRTPDAVVLIHNHNNVSHLSIDDLMFFLKHEAVKTMAMVDDAGNFYLIEKEDDKVYNFDEILTKDEIWEMFLRYREDIIRKKEWKRKTRVEKLAIYIRLYALIFKKYLLSLGVRLWWK